MYSSHDTHIVYKSDLDRLISATDKGDLDEAYVVAAKVNGNGRKSKPKYRGEIDAIDYILRNEEPRFGTYSEFFVIPPGLAFPDHGEKDDDEPF
jgi:hypothetical protein